MDIYCAFYDMDTNKVYAWQSDRNIVAIVKPKPSTKDQKALLDRIPKDILDQDKREACQAGKQHESR